MPVPASEKKPSLGLEALMVGYQQADMEAARGLIDKVSPLLLRFFWVQDYRNRRHAEDLVQETWMRVHRARPTYRANEPVLPWIFAIARYTALDYHRRSRRVEARTEQVEDWPNAAFHATQEEPGTPNVEELLAGLPASQREVIVMLKVSDMTLEEVALATASSVGSVKQKAHRAYVKLRELLAHGGGSQ